MAENSVPYLLPTYQSNSRHEKEVDKQVDNQILLPQTNLVLFISLVVTTYMTLSRKVSVCNI